jgi:hypothetical protein
VEVNRKKFIEKWKDEDPALFALDRSVPADASPPDEEGVQPEGEA